MNTTFLIDGGMGRVISAIPALEKFHKENPNDDFKVAVCGWEFLLWYHPILNQRLVQNYTEDFFDLYIANNRYVVPEPYHQPGYYNQNLNLSQAFNKIINNTDDHSDLSKPNLFLTSDEKQIGTNIIDHVKKISGKDKVLVIQPYGSLAQVVANVLVDYSHRSLNLQNYLKLTQKLSQHAALIYFGLPDLRHNDDVDTFIINDLTQNLRLMMSVISLCDGFVGCDSMGQHVARAFDKNGVVILGSTFEQNVSYTDYENFKFYRKPGTKPIYEPIRISDISCQKGQRLNNGIMDLNDNDIDSIANLVLEQLYGKENQDGTKLRAVARLA